MGNGHFFGDIMKQVGAEVYGKQHPKGNAGRETSNQYTIQKIETDESIKETGKAHCPAVYLVIVIFF